MNQNLFVYNASLLCKAKACDGEWVVGYYTPEHSPQTDMILHKIRFQNKKESHEHTTVQTVFIDPDTICRCIGIQDINNQFIFDGDFVKHYTKGKDHRGTFEIGKVFFDSAALSWKRTVEYTQENGQQVIISRSLTKSQAPSAQMSATCDYEVIGNWRDDSLEKLINKAIGGSYE